MSKLVVAFLFLGLNFYIYNYMARTASIPARETFASFPMEIDGWRCAKNEPLDPDVKENLGATDTLICNYTSAEDPIGIGLYVGYHATQIREEGGGSAENSIHPPAHCLPGSGWDITDSRTVPVTFSGVTDPDAHAKRLIITKGANRQLVYYWYQMQGRYVAEDWQKILYVGYDRATTGRTDGALVRFTMPVGDHGEDVEPKLLAFAARVVSMLPRYVPG